MRNWHHRAGLTNYAAASAPKTVDVLDFPIFLRLLISNTLIGITKLVAVSLGLVGVHTACMDVHVSFLDLGMFKLLFYLASCQGLVSFSSH